MWEEWWEESIWRVYGAGGTVPAVVCSQLDLASERANLWLMAGSRYGGLKQGPSFVLAYFSAAQGFPNKLTLSQK
jgi:hypothetical protein